MGQVLLRRKHSPSKTWCQGSLTGENGRPYGKGSCWSQHGLPGQDADSPPGGGGVNGGLAGNSCNEGSGAGSSSPPA